MATVIEQLESMRDLQENWDGYGAAPPRADLIDLAQEFVGLLSAVRKGNGSLGPVHVSPTRTGGVLLEWEDPLRQHEVEVCSDGSLGFLHLNKVTQEMESRKFLPGKFGVLPPGLLHEIRQLIAAQHLGREAGCHDSRF